jgi:hypothetical protein
MHLVVFIYRKRKVQNLATDRIHSSAGKFL